MALKFSKLLLLSLFIFSSCGDDECDNISEIIAGDWMSETSTISFGSDGTYSDEDMLIIIGNPDSESSQKSWTFEDSRNEITFIEEINGNATSQTARVTGYECDWLELDLGQNVILMLNRI